MAKKELKPEEVVEKNWAILTLDGYDNYVMSVPNAARILELLESTYVLKREYNKEPVIIPMSGSTMTVKTISSEEYKKYRLNHILGVNDVDKTDE